MKAWHWQWRNISPAHSSHSSAAPPKHATSVEEEKEWHLLCINAIVVAIYAMDPLSITASVVGLTATCVQTAKALHDLKDKFQNASFTISAICTETTIISASLSRIQSTMLGNPDSLSAKLSARPDLEATLDQALTGCYLVFDVLQSEVQKLTEASQLSSLELGLRAKLRYVWNESNMKDILNQLRGLQTALTLLLQVLGTDTMAELKQLMDNNTTVLSQVVERTAHFRTSKASQAPQSIFDMSFATQSIHQGDGSSVISSTFFSFDNEIVNAQAYRRVLAKAYGSRQGQDQTETTNSNKDSFTAVEDSSSKTLSLDPESTQGKDDPDSTETELADEIRQLSSQTQSLTISPTPVLPTTPKDQLLSFLYEKKPSDQDWLSLWALKDEDVKGVAPTEIQRQYLLQEIITQENNYLHQLQVVRYLYKYRLVLDTSISMSGLSLPNGQSFNGQNFPGYEDIYHCNKTLLYDPLKVRQSAEGPWISGFWDIFQNWLDQSSAMYVEYCARYPSIIYATKKEATVNARFARFLDQSREHKLAQRLGWETYLKCPITRLQRYCLMLEIVRKKTNKLDVKQKLNELDQLILDFKALLHRCDEAIGRSAREIDVYDIRMSVSEDSRMLLFPKGTEIQLKTFMNYKESRLSPSVHVCLIVIRKPESCIVLLKKLSKVGGIAGTEPEYERFYEIRDLVSVTYASQDGLLSLRDRAGQHGSRTINLVKVSRPEADALTEAIKAADIIRP